MDVFSTMNKKDIKLENEKVLSVWNYESTWREIISVAKKYKNFE